MIALSGSEPDPPHMRARSISSQASGRRKFVIASDMTAGALLGSEGGVRMPQCCRLFHGAVQPGLECTSALLVE